MIGQLSAAAVSEYQENYKREFGEEISFEEAKEQGMRLLKLFDIVYKPINKEALINKD